MLIQFFPNGQGGGAGPVDYLVAREVVAYSENRDVLRDDHGAAIMRVREPLPEVLRGDPERTEALIDATPHNWTYRAGVVSFAPEDAPNEQQQIQAMDAFEALAFAGLEPDQRDILWVRHTHEDRVELHFVTPRMELASGRSLNIAPPGYQAAFDALRDVLNKEHGWADPLDPTRSRDMFSVIEASRRGEAREVIHDWVLDQISADVVRDRPTMVSALQAAGFEIPRAGATYLTVLDPETGERFRLKGNLFNEKWTRESTFERTPPSDENGNRNAEHVRRSERLDGFTDGALQTRLRDFIEIRARYNEGRYGRSFRDEPALDRQHDGSDQNRSEFDASIDQIWPMGSHHDFDLSRGDDHHSDLAVGEISDSRASRQSFERDWTSRDSNGNGSNSQLGFDEAQTPRVPTRSESRSLSDTGWEAINDEPIHQSAKGPEATDGIRARVVELRRAVGDSLRGLGSSVHRAGEAIDWLDHITSARDRGLLGIIDRVSDFISESLGQLRERFSSFHPHGPRAETEQRGVDLCREEPSQKELRDSSQQDSPASSHIREFKRDGSPSR